MKKLLSPLIGPLLTSLLCLTLVSACGWHLRGSLNLPEGMNSLYVSIEDKHGSLITELKRLLESNNVSLAESSSDASYALTIHEERSDRRTVSVGNNALASEYELTMEVDYTLFDQNAEALTDKSTASVIRSYDYDINDVISKNEEENRIREEMRRDLVQQIMRRLRFVTKETAEGEM